MKECEQCGKELLSSEITHCSDKCLFKELGDSKSVSGTPVELWGDNDPWI